MKTAKLTAILLFLLFAIALPAITMAAVIGKITALQGDVDVLKPGMERAAPAAVQQPVSEGDIVRTKSNGKAELTFVDESVVRLAPNSRLQITEYLMEGNKRKRGVMNLFRGKMRAVVSKSRGFLAAAFGEGEKFEVRTPTAVAGVRGTDFFVSYSMGVTGIMVKEGRVDAFNPAMPGQVVLVTEGNAAFIAENKPPSPPRPANDVEMIRYTRDTDVSEKPNEDEGTITADAGTTPPAGETFGYEAPEGIEAPAADTGGFAGAVEIPSSESHPELLSDIFAPVITASGPPTYTNNSTAAFMFTFNEPVDVTYTMGNWGATSTATTSDTFSIASLAEGSWTLTVTATDAAGNITTQTYSWTTDYTAPPILNSTPPPSITNSSTVPMGLSSTETVTYQYSTDGGATWTNGSATATPTLPEGNIILDVRAVDLAGNISTALNYGLTTDYTAPASLTLTGKPAPITKINNANIGATATDVNGVTYSYTLDGATVPDGNLTNLTESAHTFVAIATDGAGNASTTSYTWTTDYKAPTAIITPVSASSYKTGSGFTTAVFDLTSNEPATYSYTLTLPDTSQVTGTGSALTFSPLVEGNYTLAVTATDAATNTSPATSLLFDLSYYTLNGQAALTASDVQNIGIASGEVIGVSKASWGSYSLILSGSWWETGSNTFTLVAGGTSTDATASNDKGYWLETITNAKSTTTGSGTFTGTSNFLYLSYDRLGTGTGVMTGSYDGATGNWVATDTGTYTETPLKWSGKIDYDKYNSGLYYNSIDGIGPVGDTYNFGKNLVGGTQSPWSGTTSLTMMGQYVGPLSTNIGPFMWNAPIYSWNVNTSQYLTYDGGAFWGLTSGMWWDKDNSLTTTDDRIIKASVYSLYIDPLLGNAGILKGSLTGVYYPELLMFSADGTWTPTILATGFDPATLNPTGMLTYLPDFTWSTTGLAGSGSFTAGGSISEGKTQGLTYSMPGTLPGEGWGVWQALTTGGYSGSTSDTWKFSFKYVDYLGLYITGTQTDGTQWSNGAIYGTTYAYGADISGTNPMTWISVGETIGTFDPVALTWQAVQTGAWLDTNKFLAMTQTAQGQAALTALNIPFAEVGKATLTGGGSNVNGSISVQMNNVTFFAYNTGAPPKIWATDSVTGNYTGNPAGIAANLDGVGGLSGAATFAVQQWAGNAWTATVNGSGTLTRTDIVGTVDVNFNGAAAGGYVCTANCVIGGPAETGTISSGTAAGTAK